MFRPSLGIVLALWIVCLTAGCGGDSGSGSGRLIEGTLTEAGGAGHSKISPKHGVGARIGDVRVCAYDQCSNTDDEGQWGFVTSEASSGGAVLFSVVGHGIDTTVVVNIPAGDSDVFLEFNHAPGGVIEVE